MQLTITHRLKLCWEILTTRSGHKHPAQEKMLSVFQRGYQSGMDDCKLEMGLITEPCAEQTKEDRGGR